MGVTLHGVVFPDLEGSTLGPAKDVTRDKIFTTAVRSIKKAKWLQKGAMREALSCPERFPRVNPCSVSIENIS